MLFSAEPMAWHGHVKVRAPAPVYAAGEGLALLDQKYHSQSAVA